jgi:Tol biopolymer transport system component
MIDEREVREMLHRRADTIRTIELDTPTAVRRARRRLALNGAVATVAAAAMAVATLAGVDAIRNAPIPADEPTPTGIFAPVAGRIVYVNDGIDRGYEAGLWAVDPDSLEDPMEGPIVADEIASDLVQLSPVDARPLGWSRDGTELLIMRTSPQPNGPVLGLLSILHADGSETPVTTDAKFILGATISPDGSHVVFSGETEGGWALYAVDPEAGPVEVLLEREDSMVYEPTFSPDGTQIAYVDGGGDHAHHVWVMNVDGSDAHEIVFNEWTAQAGHVEGLAWSPAGDRIALGLVDGSSPGIYMFAPDGSDFTQVIPGGARPYWSPDGSQIAYTIWGSGSTGEPDGPAGLAIADADGSDPRTFGFAAPGPWHPAPIPPTEPPSVPTDDVPPTTTRALAYGVDGDIFLADADGSNAVRIADGAPSTDECPPGEERAGHYLVHGTAWSPDGRYLAYWDRECPVSEGTYTVLISDAEGNVIASFPGQGWEIAWSPDSTRVAVMDVWVPEGQGDATIGIYGLDGVRQAALTLPSALTPSGDYSPVWSRDGSSILFPGARVPLDGDAPTPLSHGFDGYSPDGSRFANVEDGSLVVGDNNTPDARRAADPGEFWDLAWSPNGDLVAFEVDGTELLVRDVATGADTSLLDVTRSERLHVIEFSTDGDRILFTRSDADGGRGSLWSIGADGSDLRRILDGIDWADLRPQGRGEQA